MKKVLCILFTMVLMVSTLTLTANAMPAPCRMGDANSDDALNIKDATTVQKYVAKLIELKAYPKFMADVNFDGDVTVQDATLIQKELAGLAEFERYSTYPDVSYRGFYADYDSGKAMAGVPVTFTAVASSVEEAGDPLTYGFYVNEILVDTGSKNSFTYTFEKAGIYNVEITCINGFGFSSTRGDGSFEVVKPFESETPVITAFYPDQHTFYCYGHDGARGDVTFTANVMFGKGDYQYEFLLDGKVIQKYSDKNTYVFTEAPTPKHEEPYVITVRVKDSSTGEKFVSEDYEFWASY